MRKTLGIFLCLVVFIFVSRSLSAASFNPSYGWRTIDTPHFSIHYYQDLEPVAKKAATYFEEVYDKLTPLFQWKPWGRTEIVLTDNNDESNGLASTLPYNSILLRIVPPEPESSLSTYDDWLKTLITHEYTHILHLDAYRGFWKPWHYIFGKLISPAGLTPNWVKEGAATLEETDQTKGGRGRAASSEMMIRTAILQNQFPSIDRADGLQWEWPAHQSEYIYGVKFLEYLEKRFGTEKLMEFNRSTQSYAVMSSVNHSAKKAFGENFYQLWKEWQAELHVEYSAWEEKLKKEGMTETKKILSGQDNYYLPTFSRDGKTLAYVAINPRKPSALWLKNLETGKAEKISVQIPTQISFAPDGKSLIFSSVSAFHYFNRFYDLYRYDLETKKLKRLTYGARAKDPDWAPDGKTILFSASHNGTDTLKLYDVESKKISDFVLPPESFTQFANMRYSPDGSMFAVVRFVNQVGWELVVYNSDGSFKRRITRTGLHVESRPTWTADGRQIIFSSDEDGVNNLYAYDWQTETTRRLTRVPTGAFEPALSEDGKTLLTRYYNGEGYDIRSVPFDENLKEKKQKEPKNKKKVLSPTQNAERGTQNVPSTQNVPVNEPVKYSPFGKSLFLPRFILPGFAYLADGVLITATTGGTDPLHYHNWMAGGSYRTGPHFAGYYGRYVYNRYLPAFGLSIDDSAIDFGDLAFSTGNQYHFYESRRNTSAFFHVPVGTKQSLSASYFYEDRNAITQILPSEEAALNLGAFAGFNVMYQFGQGSSYPASISHPEKGTRLRITGTISDATFGASEKNEQKIAIGDLRKYIPLGKNNVLAMRLAGGVAYGDLIVPGTFTLGGDLGEGTFAGTGYSRYFSLRGLPVATLVRDTVLVMSAEYRLPLVSIQHGPGTWPIFVKDLHMAFFGDYGDAWDQRDPPKNSLSNFFDGFLLGVGTELRGDFVLGHGLPVTGRLGYAIIVVNRGRFGFLTGNVIKEPIRNGTIVLQFGTPF